MLIEQISNDLQISITELQRIANTANSLYRRVQIPKRNKGMRELFIPAAELKLLQRWLLDKYIEKCRIHECAMAYIRGRSIRDNADTHRNASYLLRLDLTRFFSSVTASDIEELVRREHCLFQSWTEVDVQFFQRIVCRNAKLLIGAPSSPTLSNAVFFELDGIIAALTKSREVTYTRYADDLFFSTNVPNKLHGIERSVSTVISTASWPKNLRVNRSKTIHTSRKRRQRVTGITITPQGSLSVGRSYKRTVSAMVHNIDSLSKEERASLSGHLAHAFSIESEFRSRLERKYGEDAVLRAIKNT